MSRATFFSGLLFWTMTLVGAAGLAPCLILPPCIEYQVLLAARREGQRRVAELQRYGAVQQNQIEHLQHDPAYVKRLARNELGLTDPRVETILVEPPARPKDNVGGASAKPFDARLNRDGPPPDDELASRVSAAIVHTLEQYPVSRIFILDATRPYIMGMSTVLLLAAIVLLGHARPHKAEPRSSEHGAPSSRASQHA